MAFLGITAAALLSAIGGGLNFVISITRLDHFPWVLTNLGGLIIMLAAALLRADSSNRRLWGSLIFVYSNIGFVAFGLSYHTSEAFLIPWGYLTLLFTSIGGVLAISKKQK